METTKKQLIQQGKQIIKEYQHNQLLVQASKLPLNPQGQQLVQQAQAYNERIDQMVDLITPERTQQTVILHGLQGRSSESLQATLALSVRRITDVCQQGLAQLAQLDAITV